MESLAWFWSKLRELPVSVLYGIAALVAFLLVIYYPLGMLWVHNVDDRLDFSAGQYAVKDSKGSHAVAIMVALLDREVNEHDWTPSDPFFKPGAMLDRMPAFQKGVVSALSRFSVELSDQIGRTRGSSQIDPDLDAATGKLKYPPEVFFFDNSSIMPVASSDSQYRSAMQALIRYNSRLSVGQAIYERRADNLMETLNRIASDLGSASAAIATRIDNKNRPWFDTKADVLYYDVKGRMYAYYLIMRELRRDFGTVIAEKRLEAAWDQTTASLGEGAQLRSFYVFNPAPDSQLIPNHLAAEGFYLLRARTQIEELASILMR